MAFVERIDLFYLTAFPQRSRTSCRRSLIGKPFKFKLDTPLILDLQSFFFSPVPLTEGHGAGQTDSLIFLELKKKIIEIIENGCLVQSLQEVLSKRKNDHLPRPEVRIAQISSVHFH